ncbi:MAG TPA: hypothetical protein GXX40_05975 [Firmicutes bacterium]|nr:hypothetical protein [Bacillota bacterium]
MSITQDNLQRRNVIRRMGWKQGKEEELLDFIRERSAKGISIVEALKEFAKQNGISWTTARWKYYRLRQQNQPRPGIDFSDDNVFQELGRIVNDVSSIPEVRLKPFVVGLATLTEMARLGCKLAAKVGSVQASLRELESELNKLGGVIDSWRDSSPGSKLSTIDDLASCIDQSLVKISSIVTSCHVELEAK